MALIGIMTSWFGRSRAMADGTAYNVNAVRIRQYDMDYDDA
jgi:hypothetical protein